MQYAMGSRVTHTVLQRGSVKVVSSFSEVKVSDLTRISATPRILVCKYH
jgi:hypothetical protein